MTAAAGSTPGSAPRAPTTLDNMAFVEHIASLGRTVQQRPIKKAIDIILGWDTWQHLRHTLEVRSTVGPKPTPTPMVQGTPVAIDLRKVILPKKFESLMASLLTSMQETAKGSREHLDTWTTFLSNTKIAKADIPPRVLEHLQRMYDTYMDPTLGAYLKEPTEKEFPASLRTSFEESLKKPNEDLTNLQQKIARLNHLLKLPEKSIADFIACLPQRITLLPAPGAEFPATAVNVTALLPNSEENGSAHFHPTRFGLHQEMLLQIAFDDAGNAYGWRMLVQYYDSSHEPIQSMDGEHWRDWSASPNAEGEQKENGLNIVVLKFDAKKAVPPKATFLVAPQGTSAPAYVTAGKVNDITYGLSHYQGDYPYMLNTALFCRIQAVVLRAQQMDQKAISAAHHLALIDRVTAGGEAFLRRFIPDAERKSSAAGPRPASFVAALPAEQTFIEFDLPGPDIKFKFQCFSQKIPQKMRVGQQHFVDLSKSPIPNESLRRDLATLKESLAEVEAAIAKFRKRQASEAAADAAQLVDILATLENQKKDLEKRIEAQSALVAKGSTTFGEWIERVNFLERFHIASVPLNKVPAWHVTVESQLESKMQHASLVPVIVPAIHLYRYNYLFFSKDGTQYGARCGSANNGLNKDLFIAGIPERHHITSLGSWLALQALPIPPGEEAVDKVQTFDILLLNAHKNHASPKPVGKEPMDSAFERSGLTTAYFRGTTGKYFSLQRFAAPGVESPSEGSDPLHVPIFLRLSVVVRKEGQAESDVAKLVEAVARKGEELLATTLASTF